MRHRRPDTGDLPMGDPAPPPPSGEPFADATAEPPVRGFLHRPAMEPAGAVVLGHGAGSDCRAPLLVALATTLAARRLCVLRCDLPFRQLRATGPPGPRSAASDQAGLRRAAALTRGCAPGRLILGGHSYGGRQASLLCADDAAAADVLLLLSYPLHPPGRPAEPRTAHFPRLLIPTLFVHGARDPFGTLEDVDRARALVPAPTALLPIEGAGHDLHHARRPGSRGAATAARIAAALLAFLETTSPRI